MEEILIAVLNRIEQKVAGLSLIDEDTGQIDLLDSEQQDTYPVTFPCVLVGNTDINWTEMFTMSKILILKANHNF